MGAAISAYSGARFWTNAAIPPGGDGDDLIEGGPGDDVLDGGGGDDTLIGGPGADTLNGGSGMDTASYAGALSGVFANLADASLNNNDALGDTYTSIENLTGTDFADTLTGDGGANILDGGAGIDAMFGGAGDDTYLIDTIGDKAYETPGQGADTVITSISYSLVGQYIENLILIGSANIDATGNSLNNTISGNDHNNRINGGAGVDIMHGGAGNDTYIVSQSGDKAFEQNGAGIDTVESSLRHYSLIGQYIENLILTGSENISGNGNTLNNTIIGNAGDNSIDGRQGADILKGGAGNDFYYVDNIGDKVYEEKDQGYDILYSSLSYNLSGQYIESLTLKGDLSINGTGNSLDNWISGNGGDNIIDGGIGADMMFGHGGNDTYIVDNIGDRVNERYGSGLDTIKSSITFNLAAIAGTYVEQVMLTGSSDINATGNGLANTLIGNSGNNILAGGKGHDILTGGFGNDGFLFNATLDAKRNIDTLTDFVIGEDVIQLDKAIFTAFGTTGAMASSAFFAGTSGVAHDLTDRIIYETDTGKLFYDSNGSAAGGAVQFAVLEKDLALTAADFFIL